MKKEFLTIQHYKEPLLALKQADGFGYYGALSVTTDGRFVQCHICGKLFQSLYLHVSQKHHIGAKEYKELFQLSPRTALISERERYRRQQRTLVWIETMKKKYGKEWDAIRKEWARQGASKRGKFQPKIRLETKNKRGTCPDQLIAKIQEIAKKVGHTPTLAEFIVETKGQRYKHLIFKTFGSWLNALKLARLQPAPRNATGTFHHYTNEELLEYLVNFARSFNKVPTSTDFRRRFLPTYDVYLRRFGTIDKARELAGVYDFVSRGSMRGVKKN